MNNKDKQNSIGIFTIGYQGIRIDEFISILSNKGIKVVLDIRNKPFSYKYGFSKNVLDKFLSEAKIQYINIPDLGIPSRYRKRLNGNKLWRKYRKILDTHLNLIDKVSQLLKQAPTVLMCYESNPDECHRSILSEIVHKNTGLKVFNYSREKKEWIPKGC